MDFKGTVRPIDKTLSKTLLIALAIIIISVGASIFTSAYLLTTQAGNEPLYGAVVVWIGCMLFFYSVITEEHTMKELFIRQSYFFSGLLSMIMAMFFVSVSGFVPIGNGTNVMEFGVLILVLGAALVILSAQRSRDYSKLNGFFALFAGALLIVGGVIAGSLNISYAGIFIMIFSGFWLGLRDKYAQ